MNVAHFNTFPYGGAATAAIRIHHGLNQYSNPSVSSKFWYRRNERGEVLDESFRMLEFHPERTGLIQSFLKKQFEKARLKRIYRAYDTHLAQRSTQMETFAMAELPESLKLDWSSIQADVAHLHWISFLADYPSFFESIPSTTPIVWTLHDMNAFTGGCHYSNQCEKFRTGCGGCPQVIGGGVNDVSQVSFDVKRKAFADKRISVVAPSNWLKDKAAQSPVWPIGTDFHTIRYGLDLAKFQPTDRAEARKKLQINPDSVVVVFGADETANPRKGFLHLIKALRLVEARHNVNRIEGSPEVEAVVFGAGRISDLAGLPKLTQLGFVSSIERQRLIYSAADMVVVPSLEDNQPQIGLEAMACGTPVVGFDVGGINEYVRDGKTGVLVKAGSDIGLAGEILRLSVAPEVRSRLGVEARKMMETEFEIGKQTAQYVELYKSLVGSSAVQRRKAA